MKLIRRAGVLSLSILAAILVLAATCADGRLSLAIWSFSGLGALALLSLYWVHPRSLVWLVWSLEGDVDVKPGRSM